MQKEGWKGLFRPENKRLRSHVALALFVGVFLLAAGKSSFSAEKESADVAQSREAEGVALSAGRETEQRMAEVLSQIAGAGKVEVMLTYRRTGEKTIAREELREESTAAEGNQTTETLRLERKAVLLEDRNGNATPILLSEAAPQTEGVVIVAEGGGDPSVCQALHQAAQAVLDVPAHKIVVLKMK